MTSAALFLGEGITLLDGLAAALLIGGVTVVSLAGRRPSREVARGPQGAVPTAAPAEVARLPK
jgi:O-acetylserine/cysteine efflux transporter